MVNTYINVSINESNTSVLNCEIMKVEVEQVVKKMKHGKSTGFDEMLCKMYK